MLLITCLCTLRLNFKKMSHLNSIIYCYHNFNCLQPSIYCLIATSKTSSCCIMFWVITASNNLYYSYHTYNQARLISIANLNLKLKICWQKCFTKHKKTAYTKQVKRPLRKPHSRGSFGGIERKRWILSCALNDSKDNTHLIIPQTGASDRENTVTLKLPLCSGYQPEKTG